MHVQNELSDKGHQQEFFTYRERKIENLSLLEDEEDAYKGHLCNYFAC